MNDFNLMWPFPFTFPVHYIYKKWETSREYLFWPKDPREYEICSNIYRNLSSLPLTEHNSFTWLAQHITTMGGNRPTHTKTLIQNIQLEEGIWISSTIKNSSNFNQWEPLGMQNRFSLNQTPNELGLRNLSHWKHPMLQHRHFTFLLSPVAGLDFFSGYISTMELFSWHPADEDSIGCFVHLELQNQNWNLLFLSTHK